MTEAQTFEGNGLTVKIADIKNVTPQECIEIAKCGAQAWNCWQENKPNEIIFPEDFLIPEDISFSGFKFESAIRFSGTTFKNSNNQCFENTHFNSLIVFNKCIFKHAIDLTNVVINGQMYFHHTTFEDDFNAQNKNWERFPGFTDSTFRKRANFNNATFLADFTNCKFNEYAYFSNSNFRAGNNIFHTCIFSGNTDFSNTTFQGQAIFVSSKFNALTDFSETIFYENVYLNNTEFFEEAVFTNTKFEKLTNFSKTKLSKKSSFSEAIFKNNANFSYTQFGEITKFKNSTFLEAANFRAAQFTSETPFHYDEDIAIDFSGSAFMGDAIFDAGQWNGLRSIYSADYENRKEWADKAAVTADKLASIDFSGTKFNGHTSFQGRKFIGITKFGPLEAISKDNKETKNTIFKNPPNFHECEFHQNTSFFKAEFPPPIGSDSAARAYRTLKLAFSKKYDLRQEQIFFKLEMQEESKIEKSFSKKICFKIFEILSGFGFSILRPLAFIALTTALSMIAFGHLANLRFCKPSEDRCNMFGSLIQFTLSSIPGFEKLPSDETLKIFLDMNVWVTTVSFLYKISMLLGLFFLGLALRNQFKMK